MCRFNPWVGKIAWRRAWQPTPVFLPGESHGQEPGGHQSTGVAKSRARLNQLHVHVFTMDRINLLCVILGLVLLSAASEVSHAAQRGSEQACWSKGLSQEMQKMASLEKLQKQRQ